MDHRLTRDEALHLMLCVLDDVFNASGLSDADKQELALMRRDLKLMRVGRVPSPIKTWKEK